MVFLGCEDDEVGWLLYERGEVVQDSRVSVE